MKKNILILTDFSDNATAAAEAGLALSLKLRTDLLLFHTYIEYPALPFASAGGCDPANFPLKKHQAEQKLKCLTEGLECLAVQSDTGSHQPAIHFRTEDGDLGVDMENILEQESIELIVMGARSEHPDDPLPGADTSAVIRYANRPVLAVPAGTNMAKVHQIVFATDFDLKDLEALRYLIKLCKLFGFGLEVVHVNLNHTRDSQEEITFREALAELHETGLRYLNMNGGNLIRRLNNFMDEHSPAILALRHHQYPFFIDLFVQSKSKALLAAQKVPLLIFPQNMK